MSLWFFQLSLPDGSFLRTLASSLIDFNELSSVAALNMLLEVGFLLSSNCVESFNQQVELLSKQTLLCLVLISSA